MSAERAHASTLRDYLGVLRRRKWVFIQALLLVPLAAVLLSLRQDDLYQAQSQVLVERQDLGASITGGNDSIVDQQPERFVQTQAELADTPRVARRTLLAAGLNGRTVEDFLDSSSVSAKTNADILEFRVTDPDPEIAKRLATAFARQFMSYRLEIDTGALISARKELEQELAALEASGERGSALYAFLRENRQELRTRERLKTSNLTLAQPASDAKQVQPRPTRDGLLGLVLGLALGLALVFLWEALDTRIRSAAEVGARLQLSLLARLSEPSRKLRQKDDLVSLTDPYSHDTEPFRVFRTNLEFVNLDRGCKSIMVTSGVEQEGKSTTIANLAVTMARGGARVVLVDLDLRRPYLDRFFHLDGHPGVTDVALGHAELDDALVAISLAASPTRASANRNGREALGGVLNLLTSGPIPPDPGEFIATDALSDILASLAQQFDTVLIDAPPLLRVGDAMTLSAKVDGLFVVTRLNVIRRPMLDEIHRVLESCPCAKLGFVLTAAEREEGYGYGAYYHHAYKHDESREKPPITAAPANPVVVEVAQGSRRTQGQPRRRRRRRS